MGVRMIVHFLLILFGIILACLVPLLDRASDGHAIFCEDPGGSVLVRTPEACQVERNSLSSR